MAKKPVIAVDLDEVLGQFVPAIVAFHNATYGSSYTAEDFFSYRFADVWQCHDDEAGNASSPNMSYMFVCPYYPITCYAEVRLSRCTIRALT